MGFATQGVEALRQSADVSLRTLYKYFPSREAMVLGALEFRDRAYFDWIEGGPEGGADHVLHPISRLADWLEEVANTGCLFMNAMAAYPESREICEFARAHKRRLAHEFRQRLARVAPEADIDRLAETLFLMHEGLTETARIYGPSSAKNSAMRAARATLAAEGIT